MPDNALLVGLLGAGSALAGVLVAGAIQLRISQQITKELLMENDRYRAHAMQRDIRGRLDQSLAAIYAAASAYVTIAEELATYRLLPTSQGNPPDNRLLGDLRQVNIRAQDSLAMLALQGGFEQIYEQISDAYQQIRVAFDTYRRLGQTQGTYDLAELQAAVDGLQQMMLRSYSRLGMVR